MSVFSYIQLKFRQLQAKTNILNFENGKIALYSRRSSIRHNGGKKTSDMEMEPSLNLFILLDHKRS